MRGRIVQKRGYEPRSYPIRGSPAARRSRQVNEAANYLRRLLSGSNSALAPARQPTFAAVRLLVKLTI